MTEISQKEKHYEKKLRTNYLWTFKNYGPYQFIPEERPGVKVLGKSFYTVNYVHSECSAFLLKSNLRRENFGSEIETDFGNKEFRSIFLCPACMKLYTTAQIGQLADGYCFEYDLGTDPEGYDRLLNEIDSLGSEVAFPGMYR